jgi:hypothetical protein
MNNKRYNKQGVELIPGFKHDEYYIKNQYGKYHIDKGLIKHYKTIKQWIELAEERGKKLKESNELFNTNYSDLQEQFKANRELRDQLKAKDEGIERQREDKIHAQKIAHEAMDEAEQSQQEVKRLKEVLGKVDLVAELGQPIKINGNLHQIIKELIENK